MDIEFKDHLQNMFNLEEDQAERIMEEFSSYYSETVDQYIRRRHDEMKADSIKNNVIYKKLLSEINQRTFAYPELSERQVRRIIYG